MTIQRYNSTDAMKALQILGFNVRDPDGGKTVFCIHKLTQEEVWIPKTRNSFLEDVLVTLFKPIQLRFIFFKSVYIDTLGNSQQPSDQY